MRETVTPPGADFEALVEAHRSGCPKGARCVRHALTVQEAATSIRGVRDEQSGEGRAFRVAGRLCEDCGALLPVRARA